MPPSTQPAWREDARRRIDRMRRGAVHRLGGVMPERGLTYDELVSLLYPSLGDDQRSAVDEAAAGDLACPSTIRRMLGAVEHQVAPTTFSVQMTARDTVPADVGPVTLFCDSADRSVSAQMVTGSYEPHLTALFTRYCRPGMTVVDVGANIGYYALLAAGLVGPSGRVVAVEPSSENCRLLLTSMRAAGLANVDVRPVACDRGHGWAYYSTHIGSNGGLVDDGDLLARPGVVVPTAPLDELVDGPVGLVKMDVEGAEGRVVSGARRLFEQDRPVVFTELSEEMLTRVSGTSPAEYLGYFEDLGYSVAVIDRVSGEPRSYRDVESLLSGWSDRLQIEDILLLPPSG